MYSHYYYPNELYHHGIKGMKWGVRRFQNRDGSLTSAGERRRNIHDRAADRISKDAANLRKHGYTKEARAVAGVAKQQRMKAERTAARRQKLKKVLGATLGAAALAGAAYGGRKLYKSGKLDNAILRVGGRAMGAYGKAKTGISRGISKAKYGVGYAQGTASRLGRTVRDKAFNLGARGVTSAIYRGQQAGGAINRGAQKYGSIAKNFAKAGVSKAKYGVGYAQGAASRLGRTVGDRARDVAGSVMYKGAVAAGKARNAANKAYVNRKRRKTQSWVWVG